MHRRNSLLCTVRTSQTRVVLPNVFNCPYNKEIGSETLCLSVPRDLANRQIDMALPYREAIYRSWEGHNYFFVEDTSILLREIAHRKKSNL